MTRDNKPVTDYLAQIEGWRKQREAELRAPDGWLSLCGLFVLTEGCHTVGNQAGCDILLPASAPAELGIIEFRQGKTSLTITSDAPVFVNGVPARQAILRDNSNRQKPTFVTVGSITFFIHTFGGHSGIRVKDSANPALYAFAGCRWFAVKPEYCVSGRYLPHPTPRLLPIQNTVQAAVEYASVGQVEFELNGQTLRLAAAEGAVNHQRFIVFRDATAGKQTYGLARFLYVDVNPDGSVVVDFNKAYNPPCAFTPFATCPLPPRENILPVPITAGECYPPIDRGPAHH